MDDASFPDHEMVQELLHGLIRSRCREFELSDNFAMPSMADIEAAGDEPFWLPVEGMYGGFSLSIVKDRTALIAESWSRVVGMSERTHRITADEVVRVRSDSD